MEETGTLSPSCRASRPAGRRTAAYRLDHAFHALPRARNSGSNARGLPSAPETIVLKMHG